MPPKDYLLEACLAKQEQELATMNYHGPMGRIRWKSRARNYGGQGEWIPLAVAYREAEENNKKYPELVHLVEVE